MLYVSYFPSGYPETSNTPFFNMPETLNYGNREARGSIRYITGRHELLTMNYGLITISRLVIFIFHREIDVFIYLLMP